MYCVRCGKELSEGHTFCGSCGYFIGNVNRDSNISSTPVPPNQVPLNYLNNPADAYTTNYSQIGSKAKPNKRLVIANVAAGLAFVFSALCLTYVLISSRKEVSLQPAISEPDIIGQHSAELPTAPTISFDHIVSTMNDNNSSLPYYDAQEIFYDTMFYNNINESRSKINSSHIVRSLGGAIEPSTVPPNSVGDYGLYAYELSSETVAQYCYLGFVNALRKGYLEWYSNFYQDYECVFLEQDGGNFNIAVYGYEYPQESGEISYSHFLMYRVGNVVIMGNCNLRTPAESSAQWHEQKQQYFALLETIGVPLEYVG